MISFREACETNHILASSWLTSPLGVRPQHYSTRHLTSDGADVDARDAYDFSAADARADEKTFHACC